jgi:hypothetical protein
MIVAGTFSFKAGKEYFESRRPHLLEEIYDVIGSVSSRYHLTKVSKEKTMPGRTLFEPRALNRTFKKEFRDRGWGVLRIACEYSSEFYAEGYHPPALDKGAFREMDFVKQKVGVEVQFGKYAFMVYNVCAKMTIFRNLCHIDSGVEIVPTKQFADQMSTGVSYFEQIVWDLQQRGVADIDVPALILGIDS